MRHPHIDVSKLYKQFSLRSCHHQRKLSTSIALNVPRNSTSEHVPGKVKLDSTLSKQHVNKLHPFEEADPFQQPFHLSCYTNLKLSTDLIDEHEIYYVDNCYTLNPSVAVRSGDCRCSPLWLPGCQGP